MSLNIDMSAIRMVSVHCFNVTHNLTDMAQEAGIYKHVWRPEELNITTACELIEPLEKALNEMNDDPERFKKHNPSNGWGDYEGFLDFLRQYIEACREDPDAEISVSR